MTADTGSHDELENTLAEWLRDPEFARAWKRVNRQHPWTSPKPLRVAGHEYHRRQKARRRRDR